MLHHVLLEVSDLERSASFYDSLLAPLGWRRHFEEDETIGWGIAKPVFFIASHHEPKAGFGLLSFSGLGIVAVKAAWEGAGAPEMTQAMVKNPNLVLHRAIHGQDITLEVTPNQAEEQRISLSFNYAWR